MRITNIDLSVGKLEKISGFLPFTYEVIESIRKALLFNSFVCEEPITTKKLPHSPIRKFYHAGYDNVYNLAHTIPIYLKNTRDNEIDGCIDQLGAYFPNIKNDDPYIELYIEYIEKAANNNDEHYKWLFTKVLLHELAHAALDNHNRVLFKGKEKKLNKDFKDFCMWREESMANAVALRIINEYCHDRDNDFYNYAKDFMVNQAPQYALGVRLEDFDYWDFNSVMENKEKGVKTKLQKAWLTYVDPNHTPSPDWAVLKHWNAVLTSSTVYKFKGYYYADSEYAKLVYDIIRESLPILKKNNGNHITYDILCSQFKILEKEAGAHGIKKLAPSNEVQSPSCFFSQENELFELGGDKYALYAYWYEKEMDEILNFAKTNHFGIVKY